MSTVNTPLKPHLIVGWREHVALPTLGIEGLVGKIDTGAKTSSLHALNVEEFERDGATWVRFITHPTMRKKNPAVKCEAKVLSQRQVTSSNGNKEKRYVIATMLCIGSYKWPIEITLAARSGLEHRMLVGRSGLANHALVDPLGAYLQGPARPEMALKLRNKRFKLDDSHV